VTDAFDVEKFDGVLDLLGPAGFSGMGDQVQAVLRCVCVGFAEIGKCERQFIAAETEGDYSCVAVFGGEAGHFHGGSGAELADRVENKLHLRAGPGRVVAGEYFAQGREIRGHVLFAQKHYADGESDFGVKDVLLVESGCGVLRELRVVVRFAKEGSGPFEEFQELRKPAQVITGGELVVFKRYGVFLGKGFYAVRLEHPFQVQVEFGLGELAEAQFGFRGHKDSLAGGEEEGIATDSHRPRARRARVEMRGSGVLKATAGPPHSKDFRMEPAGIAYWNADGGELKNLAKDEKTLLGFGKGEKSLLLVRQEGPGKISVESVE